MLVQIDKLSIMVMLILNEGAWQAPGRGCIGIKESKNATDAAFGR